MAVVDETAVAPALMPPPAVCGPTRPALACPARPSQPLSSLQLLRIGLRNSLAVCDEQLFEELIVQRRFFTRRTFVISAPDGVKHVLQDNYDNYPRMEQIRRAFHFLAGTGMLCAEGDLWRRHRRLVNPTLDYRALRGEVEAYVVCAEETAKTLTKVPDGESIDVGAFAYDFVASVNSHLFAAGDKRIHQFLRELARYPGRISLFDVVPVPRPLAPIARYFGGRAIASRHADTLHKLIEERRAPSYSGPRDMLWRLIHSCDRATGETLSDDELCDELMTLANTAITPQRLLSWVWYLLATHRDVEAALHRELETVLAGRPPGYEDFSKLVFLRQVLNETMRLYPPLPVTLRTALADDVVCGKRIPAGAIIIIAPWIIHRHRQLWASPDEFKPARFSPHPDPQISRYSFIPFGIGPHTCTGMPLSMVEATIAVAVLAQRFTFRLLPGHQIQPVGWTSLRAEHGIRVTVVPRL